MSMRTPKFSIVVPIYNVESYLPKCIDSIRKQTLEDIEIILVDDGSPDRCGEMAESYALRDNRIKVVHRHNGGLGPARNSGIDVAQGEYVGFVDSDDWIEPDMFERLYSVASARQADVVFTGFKTVSHGKIIARREHPFAGKTLCGQNEIFSLRAAFYGAPPTKVLDDPVPISVWIAGYRRAFLEENLLRFIDIRSEDKFFNTYACRAAKTVACISGTPYCYRKDDQPSITKTFKKETLDSFFTLFCALDRMADEELPLFWNECHIRKQRCVIDYSRVLIGMIESSSVAEEEKKIYVRKVLSHPMLRSACRCYPWWNLPIAQAMFYIALSLQSVWSVRTMMRLRSGFR